MRILIDLDGVLADFVGEADRREINYDTAELLKGFYRELPLIQDSKWAVNELEKLGHELFICTTAPWANPDAWKEKREWVEEHFTQSFHKRIIMTHHKNLVRADILIDDREGPSTLNFQGEWIWFNRNGMDWKKVVEYIKTKS